MNKELQKVTKEWMKLERKTLEQRKEADRYYDEHLMDERVSTKGAGSDREDTDRAFSHGTAGLYRVFRKQGISSVGVHGGMDTDAVCKYAE